MQVYTRRIVGHTFASTAAEQLYVNDTGQVVIIRDLVIGNPTGAVLNVVVELLVPGPYWLFANPSIAAFSSAHTELRQELPPGGELWASSSAIGTTLLVTAYVLTPP